jgi:hypothetical protein
MTGSDHCADQTACRAPTNGDARRNDLPHHFAAFQGIDA